MAAQPTHSEPAGRRPGRGRAQGGEPDEPRRRSPAGRRGLLARASRELPAPGRRAAAAPRGRSRRARGAPRGWTCCGRGDLAIAPPRGPRALELARASRPLPQPPRRRGRPRARPYSLGPTRGRWEHEAGPRRGRPAPLDAAPRNPGVGAGGKAGANRAAVAIVKAVLALATAAGSPDGVGLAQAALAGGGLLDAEPSIAIGLAIDPFVPGDRSRRRCGGTRLSRRRRPRRAAEARVRPDLPRPSPPPRRPCDRGRGGPARGDRRPTGPVSRIRRPGPHPGAPRPDAPRARRRTRRRRTGGPQAARGAVGLPGYNSVLMARGRLRARARTRGRRRRRTCSSSDAAATRGPCAIRPRSRGAPRPRSPSAQRSGRRRSSPRRRSRSPVRSAPQGRSGSPCAPSASRGGAEAAAALEEAVEALATSPARLEHARALVDRGGARRRSGSGAPAARRGPRRAGARRRRARRVRARPAALAGPPPPRPGDGA